MLTFILEAALRSILMAAAVWAAIRLLRVQAVLAQKVAWVLVLAAAALMPVVMHSPWLAISRAVRIPLQGISSSQLAHQAMQRLRSFAPSSPSPVPADESTSSSSSAQRTLILSRTVSAPSPRVTASRATRGQQASAIQTSASKQPSAQQPSSAYTTSVLTLPVSPLELSVKVPVSIPGTASSLTAHRIRLALILLYAAVVVLLLLRTLLGLVVAIRVLQRSSKLHGFFDEDGRAMRVRVSPDLATPVTIGSTILLPADYAQWDREKLRVVLAHENSHVRQGDFYLQLAAGVHAAIFWFSPLGWWLQRKLSELGEALSDRAALEYAQDAASYAQVLLEFAAAPRRAPLAGVAMARTSNLSSRIERILNHRHFQLAYLGGRRHAILAAVLVPAALVAVVAGFRVVPAVHAESAAAIRPAVLATTLRGKAVNCSEGGNTTLAQTIATEKLQASDAVLSFGPVTLLAQSVAPAAPVEAVSPARAAVAPAAPVEAVSPGQAAVAPAAPEPPSDAEDGSSSTTTINGKHSHTILHNGDGDDSFSIVHQNGDSSVHWNGEYNEQIAKARRKMGLQGDYIWFERDGKSYVITDPAIVAKADAMFRDDPALAKQQAALEMQQKVLEKQMAQFDMEKAKINVETPEFRKQMAELNKQLAKLQSDEFKKQMASFNKSVDQEALAKLQEQMGSIQEQIGELQGQIGEQMGKFGEKQGELGEKMGELGEQMGRIGEEQGRHAEEAARKMQSVFDQALREGKAKPVE